MKFIFTMAAVALAAGCTPARTDVRTPPPRASDAQRVVALLDYVAADYALAVSGGVVTSADEYAEQVRFVADALEIARELVGAADDPLLRD
ncbi:MAG TPA: hypothetical protein VFO85_15980, partial [Vicinamibacteria bacterium]|nr:hypothetical protein [Vicinamibacteria bacterium]